MTTPPPAPRNPAIWCALGAFLVPLVFALFTNHVWEDYYITLRSSRNLVEGHGLVYQPGERLHTFTSPFGVLLPALFTWLGGGNDTTALWLFRMSNAALLAVTAGLVWQRTVTLGLGSIGYFSRLKTYDFPGLSSREVVEATKAGDRNYSDVVQRLKPTWLVLRPLEITREGFAASHVLDDYEPVRFWNQRPEVDAVSFLPGRTWLDFDAQFVVYRRKPAQTRASLPFPASHEYASIPPSPR